jgi:hypothetical protein
MSQKAHATTVRCGFAVTLVKIWVAQLHFVYNLTKPEAGH